MAQAIIEQSRAVWLVADCGKFGRRALVRVAHLSQMALLFTDAPPPPEMAAILRDAAVEVAVAQ